MNFESIKVYSWISQLTNSQFLWFLSKFYVFVRDIGWLNSEKCVSELRYRMRFDSARIVSVVKIRVRYLLKHCSIN